MDYEVTDAVDPRDPAFLQLEAEASKPYTQFVFADDAQMLRIRDFLLQNRLSEFAPPFARILVAHGRILGMMACLPHRSLVTVRLKAAWSLHRAGVVTHGDELERTLHLASGALAKTQQGDYYLSRIAIALASRGLGLARVLMERYEAEARGLGCRRLVLDVEPGNAGAVQLYRACGFLDLDRARIADERRGRVLEYLHMARFL